MFDTVREALRQLDFLVPDVPAVRRTLEEAFADADD
jgi:hypothetical protein